MNRKKFNGLISTLLLLGFVAQTAAALKNPYSLSDLMDVASVLIKEPLPVASLSCEEALSQVFLDLGDDDKSGGTLSFVILNALYPGMWSDYGSCMTDATNGTYVLAKVTGNFTGDENAYTRGYTSKFQKKMASAIGICVPQGCNHGDMDFLSPKILVQTDRLGWKNVSIEYFMASNFTSQVLPSQIPDNMMNLLIIILVAFVGLGIAGTVIELTKIGDIPSLNYETLNTVSTFKSSYSYDAVLLQRKKPWAVITLAFSLLYNARSMVA